ncbi:alkaline phosphatase [Egbenema bharatensis]|uniref:alkaline phosphatase n=1 Tax=Egbenema bharatensis TaxID=3463334 RepID=UPI003A8B9E8C
MAKNVIIMVPDGMGWEMARAGAIAKLLSEGNTGTTLSDFYTEGKGTGLSFQELAGFTYATTYPTVVLGDNRRSALEGNALERPTGEARVAVGSDFVFDPSFNPEEDPEGGNLVGYDPVLGGINPWTPGTDPEYIKLGWSDSSAAGTSIFTGTKTYGSGLGVDLFEQPVENIMEIAAALGKSTGTLSDVPINHATPAAPAAHVNHRNKYDSDYPDTDSILQQMLRTAQVDIILGGGHPLDLNNHTEEGGQLSFSFINESTYSELSNNPTDNLYGYTFLERGPDAAQILLDTVAELDPEAGDRLLGLYGARGQNGNLPMRNADRSYSSTGYTTFGHRGSQFDGPTVPEYVRPLAPGETDEEFILREINENPTLAEMTQAALDFLSKDPDGFFLHIEGGDLDWVLHDNNIDTTIGRMLDFDESVQVVMDWIESNGGWEENLLLIVPDHDHYLTLNDDFPALLQASGAAELTLEFDPDAAGHFWGSDPADKYQWGTHSNRPVPIYYQGAGSEVLDGFIGQGFTAYGADVPGIADHIDLVHVFYTMKAAMTGMDVEDLMAVEDQVLVAGNNEMRFGANGDDVLVSTGSNNRLFGGNGNDTLFAQSNDTLLGGNGDDVLYSVGTGDNTLVGGLGADQFWVANGSLPEAANTVVDFEAGIDVIGFLGISEVSRFDDLTLTESELGTVISVMEQDVAVLLGVEASAIDSSSFAFA